MRIALLTTLLLTASCRTVPAPDPAAGELWTALQSLCGKAFEGKLVEGTEPSDAEIGRERLVMEVRSCSDREIRIPFHVGENRSRTWVLTRTADGIRLKHDHRHEDGSPDRVTWYGGDAVVSSDSRSADFPADAHTAALLPAAATNVWTISIDPSRRFTYSLRRENRRFRVDVDLTREVSAPPPPWS